MYPVPWFGSKGGRAERTDSPADSNTALKMSFRFSLMAMNVQLIASDNASADSAIFLGRGVEGVFFPVPASSKEIDVAIHQ